jgi:hypothetical protein
MKDEKGSALVITLLVLFAVSVIGATLAKISSTDLKVAGNQRFSTNALYAAEAGLSEAIHRLSLADPTNINVGGAAVNAAIGDSKPYDPSWQTYILLTTPKPAPVQNGSIFLTGTIQDPNQDYIRYSRPSGTDDILTVEHKWRDANGNGVRDPNEVVLYDPAIIPPENLLTGFPVEIITVTGRSGIGERAIQAEVTRRTLYARTLGALYTDKAISITGNAAFCGYNHDLNVPEWTRPPGCNGFHLSAGDLAGVTTTGDDVDVSGAAADIDGYPSPTDTSSSNPFYSLPEVLGISTTELNEVLAQPDQTTVTNPFDGITYVQGDAMINSNYVGSGLLYVTGNLVAAGAFTFKGLIYVEGDVKIIGTPWVLGSVIVRGTSDYNFSAGNCGILYSEEAIRQFLGQAMPMIVLSWKEI